jgi:hypothetical protein
LLFAGFLGWTVPISSNYTLSYLNYLCKSGTEHSQVLSCSSINTLTNVFYVLFGTGLALTIIGAFWKRKKPLQNNTTNQNE